MGWGGHGKLGEEGWMDAEETLQKERRAGRGLAVSMGCYRYHLKSTLRF